jgi:hypothetical protein
MGWWEAKDENLAEPSETIIREHSLMWSVRFSPFWPRPLVSRAGPALEYETAAEGSFLSPHSFRCHIHSLQVSFDFIRKDS